MHLEDIIPPDPATSWSLFFDVDGTLIDLAPTPDAVIVPETLKAGLVALQGRTRGALALITGRTIATVDRLMAPLRLPVGGLHGADIRFADGRLQVTAPDRRLDALRDDVRELLATHAGLLVEDKGAGIAVHFRAAPAMKETIVTRLENFVATREGEFAVQHGQMVVEVRPASATKAAALNAFLAEPEFAGRRPIAFGDDITDESMFAAARAAGGIAIRIGRHDRPTAANYAMPDAASVRDWIASMAQAEQVAVHG